jgi:hypothetical protein
MTGFAFDGQLANTDCESVNCLGGTGPIPLGRRAYNDRPTVTPMNQATWR